MLIKICKYEQTEDVISTLPVGSHVLGRGDILQCNDKRVSRKHALIEISEDEAKITSTHINPCFFMAADSKTITIIPKDSSQILNNGDKFALLPDSFWFKVKIVRDDNGQDALNNNEPRTSNDISNDLKVETDSNFNANAISPVKKPLDLENDILLSPLKRYFDEDNDVENISKRCKLTNNEVVEGEMTENCNISNNALNISNSDKASTVQIKVEPTEKSCNESVTNNNEISQSLPEIKQEDIKSEEQNNVEVSSTTSPLPQATTSTTVNTQNKREKCWYESKCYRKNPSHIQQFSHPGDDDYYAVDKRPLCSFGATCYHRNSDHRRNYYHPPRTGTDNTQKKEKKRKRKTVKKAVDNEVPEDDYDYEDPFIDDSGDEYEEESEDSDSDWADSQEVEEESQETKRLLREAEQFTKK